MSFNIHTFKKVIAGKFALLMMFFLAQAVSAMADTKLYMEDFSIAVGDTKEVALILDNDKAATALEVHIDLPAGLQYVDESVSKTDRVKGRGAEVQASTQTGQLVIVVTDATIDAGEGAVVTFKLERTAALLDGAYDVDITDIVVSDANAEQINTVEETTVKVEAVGLKDCTFSAEESLEVVEGNEYQIDINLTNDGVNNLSAFQGTLILPEGLELVPGDEGKFIYTDRIPAKAEFKFQEEEGYITFVLSSSQNYMITGEEGVIFSFKVKATEDLAENTEILLTDLRVAATNGKSVGSPDVKISVYNASVLAAAKQALADEIAAATTLLGEVDQTVEPGLSLSEAIAAAQIILEGEESTTEVVNAAVETLQAAEEEFTKVVTEESAAKVANEKLADEKTAAEALKISDEAKAYEAENVKKAVADAEQAIADANTAIAAVEAKIAEGKLSTDNKEALETAIAAADKAIEDAQTAIAAAEKAYTDQKAADEAAALADAKEALQGDITAAKALNVVGMTAESVQALNDAIAAAEAALAAEEATVESLGKAKADLEAAVAGLKVDYYAFDGVAYVIDAETGKLMAAGHDWGTRGIVNEAGLDLTFATDAETKMVTIDSRVANNASNHFLGSNLYMDAAAAKWGLLKQENGFYITDGAQYVSIDADDNLVLSNDPRLWLIVTAEEMEAIHQADMEKATAENPVDATWMIQGANFNRNDARNSAWTVSEDCTNKKLSGGNNTNNCAESWHSTFTISQTIEGVPNGLYQLTAQGFWRQDGENEEVPVFFINDQTAEFPVLAGTENSMSDASVSFTEGKYTIEPIKVVVTDGVITLGVKNETNTTIWCIWDNFRLSYLGAYDDHIYIDTDLTAQFPTDYQGWTGATGLVGWAAPKVMTNDGREVAACERYESTCDNTGDVFTRTLTGLANGTYRIELYGAAAYTSGRGFESELVEGDETAVYLYAETAPAAGTRRAGGEVVKQYIPAHVATDFNGTGIASVVLDNVVVTDGTVKLGMYKEKPLTNWHVVQIKGVTAKVDAIELHTAVLEAAQTALASEDYLVVTGEERADLETAITNNTTVAEQTAEAYEAAVTALGEATTAFTAAKAAYEDYAAAQVYLVDLPYAKAEKKPVAEVATSAADATAKAEALIPALRAYYESNAALENVEGAVDMTSKIINPAAEDALDGEVWKTVLGEGSGGSINILSNEPWTDAAGVAEHKYFDGGDWGQTAWDVTLQQDVTLPAGKYMLTAKMRAAADVEQTLFAGENTTIGLSVGAAGGVFNRGWNDTYVEFELPEEATIAIGVRGVTEKQYNWMSFSDFRLVQFPASVNPELPEGVIYSWESADGTPVEMGGTIAYVNGDGDRINYKNGDYYTICLNGKKANLNDETASANAGHMVITLDEAVEAGDTIAYTAYVNKDASKKSSPYIVFENGTAVEGEVFSDEANIDPTFGGVPTLKYTIVPEDAAGSKTITLTRSQTATNLFITKLQVIKHGTVTGINIVKAAVEDGAIYNLNGQKVMNAKKGLYIINGKKVVIK